jgi:hypothetical protein
LEIVLNKKKTVGQASLEASQKTSDVISAIEQQEAMQQDYMKHLLDTIDAGYAKYSADFYVEVITKNEKLMPNVFRNYFVDRSSCPTPNYDQSVFKYNRQKEQVEYIWTIPSRDATHHLVENQAIVDKSERQLTEFCVLFASGELFKLMKKLNGELSDSPALA